MTATVRTEGWRASTKRDMCQALSVLPARKYQSDGGPGPGDIVSLLRRSMPPGVAAEEVSRFVDALIWNWLIAGTDAHAKNYSLLIASDQVRLAPLYDVASALPYRVPQRELRLAMKLGTDYRVIPAGTHGRRLRSTSASMRR